MGESRADRRHRFAPASQEAIIRGVECLERLLGPTIGPLARPVAMARSGRPGEPPELLDDAAVIARRMVGIPDRFENMGFMLARQAAWRMHAQTGDGAASAVAIGAATLRSLQRLVAAGFDKRSLVDGAHLAAGRICEFIAGQAESIHAGATSRFLSRLVAEPTVADLIRESIDVAGPDVTIVCRASVEPRAHLQWIEGALWESTAVMAPLMTPASGSIRLTDPAVLLWDSAVDDARRCLAAMATLQETGASSCVLVARSFAPQVLGLMSTNAGLACRVIPVLAPQAGSQQDDAFSDLEALTAARRLTPVAGDSLERIRLLDVGTAPRLTIGTRFLNVMSSRAQQPAIDRRIANVLHLLLRCEDDHERDRLLARLGRLRQGMGVVWIGARTEVERQRLLLQARRSLAALRAARRSGVVPGAGATLLAAVREIRGDATLSANPGALAVADGVAAPANWLARNAGHDPSVALARGLEAAPCLGLDVLSGNLVDLRQSGIVDPTSTVEAMVRVGVSMAISAFECDVLVQRPVRLSQAEIRP